MGQRILLALLLATLGCAADHDPPAAPARGFAPWSGANLVIVSIDTLRRDRLPTYGYGRPTALNLAAMAADSVVFDHAIASFTQTAPAHASIFTGLAPAAHGITRNGLQLALVPTTLAEQLLRNGYRTGGFVSGWTLSRHAGLDRGFEVWDDRFAPTRGARRHGATTARLAAAWLDRVAADKRPFFLFLHLFEPHWPYEPPVEITLGLLADRTALVTASRPSHIPRLLEESGLSTDELHEYGARYDGEIVVADRLVGELLARLEALGVADDTLLIVVADHGETLFERPWMMDHGGRVGDEQVRVPLLIRFPQRRWAGRRIAEQVSHVDLLPTVLEALGVPTPGHGAGRSLLPLLVAPADWAPRPVFSGATCIPRRYPQIRARLKPDAEVDAVRLPGLKLVEYPRADGGWEPELFDLVADPGETRDLAGELPAVTARLHRLLEGWRGASGATGEVPPLTDPEMRRALAELGYVE